MGIGMNIIPPESFNNMGIEKKYVWRIIHLYYILLICRGHQEIIYWQ